MPLRLYELRDPLPRAFWVPRPVARARSAEPSARVRPRAGSRRCAAPRARTDVRGRADAAARTPPRARHPVRRLLSGWDAGMAGARATTARAVAVLRADDRYIALATPGGEQHVPPRVPAAMVAVVAGALRGWASLASSLARAGASARGRRPAGAAEASQPEDDQRAGERDEGAGAEPRRVVVEAHRVRPGGHVTAMCRPSARSDRRRPAVDRGRPARGVRLAHHERAGAGRGRVDLDVPGLVALQRRPPPPPASAAIGSGSRSA